MVTQQSAQEVALEVLDLSVSAHASGTGVMITVDQARTLCNAVLAGRGVGTVFMTCKKHEGMPFEFTVTSQPAMRIVCPHCEAEKP